MAKSIWNFKFISHADRSVFQFYPSPLQYTNSNDGHDLQGWLVMLEAALFFGGAICSSTTSFACPA